ncbi:RecX family transcriptional regulator [Methylorubrum thiocyanatum]|uniref:RecX family transcriptional regulator n=1 Tax=Methylorubrum thiocyanatum TaxID=47958 RepID=UPI0035C79B44
MITRTVSTRREARPEPPVTAAWLERVATHYLDRYGASSEMLRRVLLRRVERRCRSRDEDPGAQAGLIDETVARAQRAGLVDDARFAAARLRGLRRRGTSTRQAQARLAAKGIDAETIAATLAEEREGAEGAEAGEPDTEERAARAYARRRRLGPYRPPGTREANRERDLAAMARAGFSYGLAKSVIGGEAEEDDPSFGEE